MLKKATNFRSKFIFPGKDVLHWFPGHMSKGLKQIDKKLKVTDCLIEVHDARVPISGRNIRFKDFAQGKPHLLVLNKKDLADLTNSENIVRRLKENTNDVIFTNCKDQFCTGVKEIIPRAVDLISNTTRFNRSEAEDYSILIIGIPNVGKSSLINILRNKYLKKSGATAVGALPGITRSVLTRIKVCQNPLIYVLDTPGILNPRIDNMEMGLKLALISTLQDHLVGPRIIADFLLFWLNKQENFEYVKYLGLEKPSDQILEVLALTAINLNKTIKRKNLETGALQVQPDLELAAAHFIGAFRRGEFGKIMLDQLI